MNKYIEAEKLIAEIEKRQEYLGDHNFHSMASEYDWLLTMVQSLQQEQPEVQNRKFVFPKYLYARTKDNKTIDMSYAPQDMTAIEYVRNDFVEQEQPEVDLENYLENYFKGWHIKEEIGLTKPDDWFCTVNDLKGIARHFWNKGYNARKEE